MLALIAFILNLPWTILGLLGGLLSLPAGLRLKFGPFAFVINVKSFWWVRPFASKRGIRATTLGHVVLLGPNIEPNDFAHELVHVMQQVKTPLIQPMLYLWENYKNGRQNNKYELEAYKKSNAKYKNP